MLSEFMLELALLTGPRKTKLSCQHQIVGDISAVTGDYNDDRKVRLLQSDYQFEPYGWQQVAAIGVLGCSLDRIGNRRDHDRFRWRTYLDERIKEGRKQEKAAMHTQIAAQLGDDALAEKVSRVLCIKDPFPNGFRARGQFKLAEQLSPEQIEAGKRLSQTKKRHGNRLA